jgi:uncharacterized membrane protein AbrB (regulator of aidB expression)
MPRRSNPLTYLALAWLGLLVLAANANVPVLDGFGMAILAMTLWSVVYLYIRLCRRWPLACWLALGFLAGLFGSRSSVATIYEHDDECVDRDTYDNCDN